MRIRDVLRLSRAPLSPTAACDAVACGCLARSPGFSTAADDGFFAPAPMLLLAATSVLVYAAGMAANDLADRRRDATLNPDRPLPSGRISVPAAVTFIVLCAAGALALHGGPHGSLPSVAAALVLAAAYDGGLKRWLVPGSAAMGLVRSANASTAVLPLVLAGTTSPLSLLGPLAIGTYSASITVLSTTEDRPSLARTLSSRGLALVAFAGAGILSLAGVDGLSLGIFLATSVVISLVFARVPRPGPVKGQVLEMLLAIYWLDAILASGSTRGWEIPVAAIGGAVALVYLSQLSVRALRPDPATGR